MAAHDKKTHCPEQTPHLSTSKLPPNSFLAVAEQSKGSNDTTAIAKIQTCSSGDTTQSQGRPGLKFQEFLKDQQCDSTSQVTVENLESETLPRPKVRRTEINPHCITNFDLIPESKYQEFSDPIVVVAEDSTSFVCIAAWDKIEAAQKQDVLIECETHIFNELSDEIIGGEKVFVQISPSPGKPRYAEIIRSTRKYFELFNPTNKRIIGRGGPRKGKAFLELKDDDVRARICKKLTYKRPTINNHLSFSEYLSDEALEVLADGNASKRFFLYIQPLKRQQIIRINKEKSLEDKIVEISVYVLKLFGLYQKNNKKIPERYFKEILSKDSENTDSKEDVVDDKIKEDDTSFSYYQPDSTSTQTVLITKEAIAKEMLTLDSQWTSVNKCYDNKGVCAECTDLLKYFINKSVDTSSNMDSYLLSSAEGGLA